MLRLTAARRNALLFASLFLLAVLPTPAGANPAVPACLGSAPVTHAQSVPNPALCEQIHGRVFPEASSHSTPAGQLPATDFISFSEFEAGVAYLAEQYPDYVTVHTVGESAGMRDLAGNHVTLPIYMLEITNAKSPMPLDDRQSLLFMLSIHGNEKGGREGGFRVFEDLVKGIGMAAEPVQDGAGLPEPIAKPTGGNVETYMDYLDFMRVFLLFPNPDGWAHDETEFVAQTPSNVDGIENPAGGHFCGTFFCRTNGNGVDLNRQGPTMGWQNPDRDVVGQPEAIGYYNWMLEQGIDWAYAIDIHGMLMHQNFVAIMLPAASMTPQEMQRSLRLAETLKERLNGNDHFAAWEGLLGPAEQVGNQLADFAQGTPACTEVFPAVRDAVRQAPDPAGQGLASLAECMDESPSTTLGSSVFAEYYTVIDAIGYTDSGFNGDYFAQDTGLNAPGYDIELAYNHITVDSQYEAGALFNDYHVKSVREIVKSFMDAAALDVQISFETGGKRTLYLEPAFVATNIDDPQQTPGGWADENPGDDLWDYGPDQPFFARPAKYWEDLKPFTRDGDAPGVLVKTSGERVTAKLLSGYDTFVIPGSAIEQIADEPATIEVIRAWVEGGGNLVLTDSALQFFDLSGLTADAVDSINRYMGGIKMDLNHPLLAKVRGGVKQTYEPTPLGFAVGANAAPNWFLDPEAYKGLGGEIAGLECGTPQLEDPCRENGVALGRVAVGSGQIQFIGALLPDPTEEFYHPYGLDHYATTYSGNQILRNMLAWDEVFEAPPVVIKDGGQILQTPNERPVEVQEATDDESIPAAGLVLLVLSLLGVVAARRR